nr:hypothetical protein [Thermoflexales bacterium]
FDQRAAKQTENDQQREEQDAARKAQAELEASTWNPHQDPLAEAASVEPAKPIGVGLSTPLLPKMTSTSTWSGVLCTEAEKSTDSDNDLLLDCDEKEMGLQPNNKDTDQDGLQDGLEVLRLGTTPTSADSDGDGVTDYLEVNGFVLAGGRAPWYSAGDQRWYSDPNSADTDKDNLPDGLECPQRAIEIDATTRLPKVANACLDTNGDGVPENCSQLQAVCRDTDADATPDMFARDSDADGVPDKLDLDPTNVLGKSAPFSRQNPFNLLVNNLSPKAGSTNTYYPVLVDFQLRPSNPKHLTYALNVLDWPSGDEKGQVQRRTGNDSTFADGLTAAEAAGDPRSPNGDMRLIPMLEIELSGNNIPLPMTTTLKTRVALQGVDTSWPVSTTPPVFTTWLSGTLDFSQAGGNVNVNTSFAGTPTLEWFNIYTGTCAAGGEVLYGLTKGSASTVLTNTNLLKLADGNHFVAASGGAGHVAACADLPDLPNGSYTDRTVDEVALSPYGVSVRDKDNAGTLLAYVPLNVTPDDGGGQTAFSARVLYQPVAGNLGDTAQRVRLVWIVQMLTDMCRPAPDGADLSEEEVWCNYEAAWNLDNVQFMHTYDDDWQLTGLSVREDHGVNLAVAWEDPASETDAGRQSDDGLWVMANGLDNAYVTGRDQNDNDIRDIGVVLSTDGATVADTTIYGRFNAPLASSVTITDRFGLPLTATLRVQNFAYAHQDGVAGVMMSGTQQILQQNFNAYTTTAPTLLFAREERFR